MHKTGTLVVLAALSASVSFAAVTTVAEVNAGTGGLELDGTGNLYHSDFGAVLGDPSTAGTRVWRVSPDGTVSPFAEGLLGASGNAIGPDGLLYQANIRGGSVVKISNDGAVAPLAAEGLVSPVGIVFDSKGTLFVANCASASIQRIDADGRSSRFVESPLLVCPNGLTIDESGNLYASNFFNGDVVRVSPNGEVAVLATLPGGNNGHLVYALGRLYVVARGAHQIYSVSLSGEVELIAGSGEKGHADGPRLEASFCYPNDIVADVEKRVLYVNEVADLSSAGRKLAPTRIRRIELPGD